MSGMLTSYSNKASGLAQPLEKLNLEEAKVSIAEAVKRDNSRRDGLFAIACAPLQDEYDKFQPYFRNIGDYEIDQRVMIAKTGATGGLGMAVC